MPQCLLDLACLDFLAFWAGKWGQGSQTGCSDTFTHTHIDKKPTIP